MSDEVTVSMPLSLTTAMMREVREDPLTRVEDVDAWHARLGWLICAYDVLLRHRLTPWLPDREAVVDRQALLDALSNNHPLSTDQRSALYVLVEQHMTPNAGGNGLGPACRDKSR